MWNTQNTGYKRADMLGIQQFMPTTGRSNSILMHITNNVMNPSLELLLPKVKLHIFKPGNICLAHIPVVFIVFVQHVLRS